MLTEPVDIAAYLLMALLAPFLVGFAPGTVLRLFLLAYPKGHARRAELVAELYGADMSTVARMKWVGQQAETALFDGLAERRRARRSRHRRRWRLSSTAAINIAMALVAIVTIADAVETLQDEHVSAMRLIWVVVLPAVAMAGFLVGTVMERQARRATPPR